MHSSNRFDLKIAVTYVVVTVSRLMGVIARFVR